MAGTYSRPYKYALWSAMAIVVVYTFVMYILLIETCHPLDAYWLQYSPTYLKPYRCSPVETQLKVSELTGALSVITDFYSVILPAIVVFRMKITHRQRVGLMLIFGLGFL